LSHTIELLGLSLSDWLAIVAAVCAVIGIPAAWFFGRQARRAPQLRFAVDFDVLVRPIDGLFDDGLSLTFRQNPVERISRSYVAFWHHVGDPVDRSDVLRSDPIRIQFQPGDAPLQARIIHRSRGQIGLSARIVNEDIVLDFRFLAAGDGGVVEILHSGGTAPTLCGTVKGVAIKQRVRPGFDLTPASLAWTTQPKRTKRIAQRLRSAATLPTVILVVSYPAMIASFTALLASFIREWLQTPHLVNPAKYDLATLDGQHAFSQDVTQYGVHPPVLFGVIFVFGVFVLALGVAVFVMSYPWLAIPRSILSEFDLPRTTEGDANLLPVARPGSGVEIRS
jgi:hypothetical protein